MKCKPKMHPLASIKKDNVKASKIGLWQVFPKRSLKEYACKLYRSLKKDSWIIFLEVFRRCDFFQKIIDRSF
jgi:hypothetical protein